jgi:hypothetical protein
MTENELISKIKKLKQIKPSENWVVLTKTQVLGDEPKFEFISIFKPAFAGITAVLVLLGLFVTAQNSLPGDWLYSFKRISEKGQAVFVSETDKPKNNLELTNKRLEELTKIAETNQVKKLAPAIEEVQDSMAKAANSLNKSTKLEKEIVVQTKKLEENKQKIEALGIVVEDGQELDNNNTLAKLVVEREIKDLDNRTLTESQQKLLEKIKQESEAGNYAEALENILFLSYPSYPQE